VLTLFERLGRGGVPFYLNLMAHLARHGIPCPAPIADRGDRYLGTLNGKPATLVTCLLGTPVSSPQPRHCEQVGAILADMHIAGRGYSGKLENPRGPRWWREAAREVAPFLDDRRRELLASELEFQARHRTLDLPARTGPCRSFPRQRAVPRRSHRRSDRFLFCRGRRAPVRRRRDGQRLVHGAGRRNRPGTCEGACGRVPPGPRIHPGRAGNLAGAAAAAALRFWLSRLYDFYLPRAGELTHAHDPEHFRRVLEAHRTRPFPLV